MRIDEQMGNIPLVDIQDLYVQYKTDDEIVYAVNGINLTIEKGQSVGLVGETGAGKTTTAKAIMKLLPKYTGKIPRGKILFNGQDILQMSDREMRNLRGKSISMVFQDPMTSLNPVMTVGAQIGEVIALHDHGLSKAQVEEKVGEILEMVGIPASRQNEYPHQFSGGMKQRVVIAIAIACQPALLIADEPTTALDVTIQAQVINMMRDLRKKVETAVLFITHDLGLVANFCDAVAVIYCGEIVEKGLLEDIFDPDRSHHPYLEGLLNSIPKLTEEADRLIPISGMMPDPTELPAGCRFHPRCPHCMEICKTEDPAVVKNGTHQLKCHLFKDNKVL